MANGPIEDRRLKSCSTGRARERKLREASRLGHPDRRCGCNQILFSFEDIRTPLKQIGRQSRGNRRRHHLFGEVNASHNLRRFAADEQAEPVFGLNDLSFEIGQVRSSSRPFSLKPIEIQFGNTPLLEAKVRQPDGFLPGLKRLFGNLHFVVQPTKIEIRLGDVADQSEHHSPLILLS